MFMYNVVYAIILGGSKMTGKTHAAVGICGATYVLVPKVNIETAIIGLGFVVIGSYAADADLKVSKSGRFISDIIYAIVVLSVLFFTLTYKMHYNIINLVDKNMSWGLKIPGTFLIIGSIALGRITGHRKYLHSLLGFTTMNLGVLLIAGDFVTWFAFGYILHMILDLLNEKPESLLFPLPLGDVCLSLISSNGKGNSIISGISYAVFLYKFYEYFCMLTKVNISNLK